MCRRGAEDFLDTHGVHVDFAHRTVSEATAKRLAATDPEAMPDILLGPHDWIGYLVREGLIEPWSVSERRRASFLDWAVRAATYDGQLYGLPYAVDAPVLIRNTDLVPDPPASVEELIDTGQRLHTSGRVDQVLAVPVDSVGNPYHMYPLFSGAGGWLFPRDSGGMLRTRSHGLTTSESMAAFDRLRLLGDKGLRVLRVGLDIETAREMFLSGRVPYLLCGSWVFGDVRRSGIRCAVSPVPPFAGHAPARPFASVHCFFSVRGGRNKTIARLAARHLTRRNVTLALHRVQPRPPALAAELDEVLVTDPDVATVYQVFLTGDLMPSMPEMMELWPLLGRAEIQLIRGASATVVARRLGQSLDRLLTTS